MTSKIVSVLMGSLAAVVLVAAPSASRADVVMGAGAGIFDPWQGAGGPSVTGHVIGSVASNRLRVGGEFEYREFDTTFFGVDDVAVDAYILRFMLHYVPFPDAIATPYVGAGIGVHVHSIDNERVEERSRFDEVSKVSAGLGGMLVGGVEVPIGPFALYGEARFDAAYQFTEEKTSFGDSGDIGAENVGGVTGLAGIRVRF